MSSAQQASLGSAARAWFEANQRNFPGLLQNALQQLA